MKIHWSRFGYTTVCGRHLDDSTHLTRNYPTAVTCLTCRRIIGVV